jgi:hypothetical protein
LSTRYFPEGIQDPKENSRVIHRHVIRTLVAIAAATTFLAPSAPAQGRGPYDPVPYRGMIGLNPLGIPFDVFSIEVEGVVAPGVTIGAAGSYNAFGGDVGPGGRDPRFGSGDVKVRYYPSEIPFRGFAVGLGVGVTNYSSRVDVSSPLPGGPTDERVSISAPTISIETDYNYLLGARQRFLVGTGVGAKRYLASESARERANAARAWAYVRFVLGMAF